MLDRLAPALVLLNLHENYITCFLVSIDEAKGNKKNFKSISWSVFLCMQEQFKHVTPVLAAVIESTATKQSLSCWN